MKQLLIAADQLANTMLGGMADETISARAWRSRAHPAWAVVRVLIDVVFFWHRDHCMHAYHAELLRRHLPRGYRAPRR